MYKYVYFNGIVIKQQVYFSFLGYQCMRCFIYSIYAISIGLSLMNYVNGLSLLYR